MKNKYTKHNNKNRETNRKGRREEHESVENKYDTSFIDNSLIEQIVASDDDFEIDIIGGESFDEDDDFEVNTIDMLDDEQDEDLANRISMYENMDDDEDEIKEFISRDYDVVSESRRRVNQPGRRKNQDKIKPAKPVKEKKKKEPKVKAEGESGTNVIKALWDKWLKVYGLYKSGILYGTLGGLAIILIITIIVLPKSESVDNKSTSGTNIVAHSDTGADATESTGEATTEKIITMEDLKAESEDSEIHKLVTGFIDAERIQCDAEKAKAYLDSDANYNLDRYKESKRYVEAYQNIKCYKFDYIKEDMYYVYVSYDLKILNIDTPAVTGEQLVIKYDKTQKKYLIHNILEDEIADMLIASNAPEVKVLNEDVIRRNNEAIAKDENLKNFLDIINSKVESTEKTSEENESTTTAN